MDAPFILHIETATGVCSVALSTGNKLIGVSEIDEANVHASQLTLLIKELLAHHGIPLRDLAAVAVSKGPGSYTGLRIGVSTAKGLCFALELPLIGVHTLDAMAYGFCAAFDKESDTDTLFCPMIDARRMEVYSAIYNRDLQRIAEVDARIIDRDSFNHIGEGKKIVLFGSGAGKFESLFAQECKVEIHTGFKNSAAHMVEFAYQALQRQMFEDVAYFEPFYLKDFVPTTPKNSR